MLIWKLKIYNRVAWLIPQEECCYLIIKVLQVACQGLGTKRPKLVASLAAGKRANDQVKCSMWSYEGAFYWVRLLGCAAECLPTPIGSSLPGALGSFSSACHLTCFQVELPGIPPWNTKYVLYLSPLSPSLTYDPRYRTMTSSFGN